MLEKTSNAELALAHNDAASFDNLGDMFCSASRPLNYSNEWAKSQEDLDGERDALFVTHIPLAGMLGCRSEGDQVRVYLAK